MDDMNDGGDPPDSDPAIEEQRAQAIKDLLDRVRAAPPETRSGTAITDDDITIAASLSTAELADLEAALKAAGVKSLTAFRSRLRRFRQLQAAEAAEARNRGGNWRIVSSARRKGWSAPAANAITILRNHPDWVGVLAWDDFFQAVVFLRPPKWFPDDAPGDLPTDEASDMLDDAGTTRISAWLLRQYGLRLYDAETYKAVLAVAKGRVVNCVMDWLDGLVWDGVQRVQTWLTTYLGVRAFWASQPSPARRS